MQTEDMPRDIRELEYPREDKAACPLALEICLVNVHSWSRSLITGPTLGVTYGGEAL